MEENSRLVAVLRAKLCALHALNRELQTEVNEQYDEADRSNAICWFRHINGSSTFDDSELQKEFNEDWGQMGADFVRDIQLAFVGEGDEWNEATFAKHLEMSKKVLSRDSHCFSCGQQYRGESATLPAANHTAMHVWMRSKETSWVPGLISGCEMCASYRNAKDSCWVMEGQGDFRPFRHTRYWSICASEAAERYQYETYQSFLAKHEEDSSPALREAKAIIPHGTSPRNIQAGVVSEPRTRTGSESENSENKKLALLFKLFAGGSESRTNGFYFESEWEASDPIARGQNKAKVRCLRHASTKSENHVLVSEYGEVWTSRTGERTQCS
jgi:hypothetical protein